VNFERFTPEGLSYIPGIVKLWESPGTAGGLLGINYFYARHFKFLRDQYVFRPTDTLIEQFTRVARPIMKQVKILREQNRELAKARDLLLPKLMNGEVAV
jgi:hypothetical protein